jgi:hypothetical protein
MLSVSGLYRIDDRVINAYGTGGRLKIGGGGQSVCRKIIPQICFSASDLGSELGHCSGKLTGHYVVVYYITVDLYMICMLYENLVIDMFCIWRLYC